MLISIFFAIIAIVIGIIVLAIVGLAVLYDTVNLIRYICADVCRATAVENNGTEEVRMYDTSRTGRYQDYYKHTVEYVHNGQLCRGEVVTERNVKPGGQMNIHVYTDKKGERMIISEKHKNRLIIFAVLLFFTIVIAIIGAICTFFN
jgi:Flp pilus assembly protein TadG